MPDQQQLQQKVHENKGTLTDPTSNVLMLVEAATKRQDDLSDERQKHIDTKIENLRREIEIRAGYEKELRIAEKARIDSIREVDVQARKSDYEKAVQQAVVLDAQLKQTAHNLQEQSRQSRAELEARLAALEKAQYENQGKSTVADPMMDEWARETKMLRLAQGTSAGKNAGAEWLWVKIIGGITVIGIIIAAVVNLTK